MGDWTYGSVEIIGDLEAVTVDGDGDTTTVGKIVREIVAEYIGAGTINDDSWTLYSIEGETRCGSAEEIADALDGVLGAHPGAFAYRVTEDPYAEWLGDLLIRVSSVPTRLHVDCDANARPLVGWEQISEAFRVDPDTPAAETLRELLGRPWIEAFGELAPARCAGHKTVDQYGNMWGCRAVLGRDGACPSAHVEVPA